MDQPSYCENENMKVQEMPFRTASLRIILEQSAKFRKTLMLLLKMLMITLLRH
jgi:hypothetical protein